MAKGKKVRIDKMQMPKITIRGLEKRDKKAIKDIFALYWHDSEFLKRLSTRLEGAINNTLDCKAQDLKYLVAEEGGQIIGVIGFRKAPEHMIKFATTDKPAELYILAVKNRGNGVGKKLIEQAMKDIEKFAYTEVLLYSGETHKDSWGFYDHLGFNKIAPATAPNGEPGFIWRKIL